MVYDIWIILITIKYMVKKSQIIKRWKKKYLGKWHGYNLPTCFGRDSREDFNHADTRVYLVCCLQLLFTHKLCCIVNDEN